MGDRSQTVHTQRVTQARNEFEKLSEKDGFVLLAFAKRLRQMVRQVQDGDGGAESGGKHLYIARSRTDESEDSEWNIRSIMWGDGSIGNDCKMLEKDELYASSAIRGGTESFWAIERGSLRLCYHGTDVMHWPAVAVTPKARELHDSRRVRGPMITFAGRSEAEKRLLVVQHLSQWVRANPGVAVIVGGPGQRSSSQTLRDHIVRSKPTAWSMPPGRCLDGAIAHAVACLLGEEAGKRALVDLNSMKNRVGITTLKSTRDILHKLSAKVEMRKPTKKDREEMQGSRHAFRWLAESAKGIWLVRVVESGIVDHCFCVDTSEALIFDSAEKYPLRLTEEVLKLCGGETSKTVKFAEAVRVVKQQQKTQLRRKRPRPA